MSVFGKMQEDVMDIWTAENANIVITTNGFVKRNGDAVMGRGCAKEATKLIPNVATTLGQMISKKGNHVYKLGSYKGNTIWVFPVKPEFVINDSTNVVNHMANKFQIGERVPGWAAVAEIAIIRRSAMELKSIADDLWKKGDKRPFFMPRPGCGAGELSWKDIKPILSKILDGRFHACTKGAPRSEKPYDEVIDLLKSEFNDDLRVIPQNMRKESVPARMLRTLGYPAESLCWIMRDFGEYIGFAASKELVATPVFKDWMKSKKVKEFAKTKKYIVVLFEEFL